MIGRYAIKTVGWILSKSIFSAWPCNEQNDSTTCIMLEEAGEKLGGLEKKHGFTQFRIGPKSDFYGLPKKRPRCANQPFKTAAYLNAHLNVASSKI